MTRIRTLLLVVTQFLALAAFAQTAEFGRASGGDVNAVGKKARGGLTGSLSLSHTSGVARGQGYEATLGGELLDERLWFFAAASLMPSSPLQTWSAGRDQGIDAKLMAQPVDWANVTASYSNHRQTPFGAPEAIDLPSSFLSLRSSMLLSERMLVDFSFSHSATSGFPRVLP